MNLKLNFGSAPWEINLVQKLCDWDIISPLRFTDDEWSQISSDGTCQNRRKSDVFKEPNGSIHYMGRKFYGFNNRFRTTKNTEAIVFENGGFVGNLGLVKKTMEEIY